jgi:hypothetical protein
VRIVQTIILFSLISYVFVGNVGLSVFTHTCEEDGVFRSFFIQLDDHCASEHEDLPACCVAEKQDKDCCQDEEKIYKVNWDYFHQDQIDLPSFDNLEFTITKFNYLNFVQPVVLKTAIVRPPPLLYSSRELLIKKQVFQI